MPASALMNVMVAAVRKAGRSLARDFGEVAQLQVSIKSPANFVSAADHRAEEILFTELSKARQGYGFLMEERGEVTGADKSHRWIVDPLDGTTNFLHAIPLFAIAVALEREGQLVASAVYNPIMDELYTAEKGKGAFVNDHRLRVAARRGLNEAVISTGIPHRGSAGDGRFLTECANLMQQVVGIRSTGSACIDLAWVSAGRFDGFWDRGLGPWDLAAGTVLIREAGGLVTDADGEQDMLNKGSVVAGNSAVQKQLLTAVSRCGERPAASPTP
jgi:myo-inositol-1(or 4)-monophosphatase